MRSPLGIVSKRLSSRTEFRDSTHSGSMSPSHTIHELTSKGRRGEGKKGKTSEKKKMEWQQKGAFEQGRVRCVTLRFPDDVSGSSGDDSVAPLARVHVHVAQQLLSAHSFRIDGVMLHHEVETLQRGAQQTPHGRLPAAARADDDHAHPLPHLLIQLQSLPHLHTHTNLHSTTPYTLMFKQFPFNKTPHIVPQGPKNCLYSSPTFLKKKTIMMCVCVCVPG